MAKKSKLSAQGNSDSTGNAKLLTPQQQRMQKINPVQFSDLKAALRAGFADFVKQPVLSMLFGLIYAAFGWVLVGGLIWLDEIWMIIPFAVGFPLIAPFAAAGLYDISRRLEKGEAFSWSDIFLVVISQRNRELGWMAFVTLFIFWIWIYQVRLLLAIILQNQSFSTFDGFLNVITTTYNGFIFLGVGSLIGAFLSTVLFTVTVISMPILLDKEIDFVSAMVASIKTVAQNPLVMLCWGAFIAAAMILAILPAFVGLIFVLPILGHATWHLYRRVID
ncbi:MAG: DUF2189 domain-containing protein [Salaquimonas sp.]